MDYEIELIKQDEGRWVAKICSPDRGILDSPIIYGELAKKISEELNYPATNLTFDAYQPIYPVDENKQPVIGEDRKPKPGANVKSFCKEIIVMVTPFMDYVKLAQSTSIVMSYGSTQRQGT